MSGLLRPADLNRLASDAETAKMKEARLIKERKDKQEQELREAFMDREIKPNAIDLINTAVSNAAKNGIRQLQVVTFPCSYCTDRGRTINIQDPDWPNSLTGFAKRAYDFYAKELRPHGYKLYAEVITYPEGMPGEAALILKW